MGQDVAIQIARQRGDKAQSIRVVDFMLLGPAMILGGFLVPSGYVAIKLALVGGGIGTVVYNFNNYILEK